MPATDAQDVAALREVWRSGQPTELQGARRVVAVEKDAEAREAAVVVEAEVVARMVAADITLMEARTKEVIILRIALGTPVVEWCPLVQSVLTEAVDMVMEVDAVVGAVVVVEEVATIPSLNAMLTAFATKPSI